MFKCFSLPRKGGKCDIHSFVPLTSTPFWTPVLSWKRGLLIQLFCLCFKNRMSYYSGHFSFPPFHYASVPLCITLQILQTLQSPLRAPFVFISVSLAMVSLCLFHLKPVTPCFLYFLSPPQFTVSNFGSVPTFSIFLCFIPFVSLIGAPSFVCLFLLLHLSPSVLLLFISLYIHTISIFIFSSLHFTCLFPFCATPFTHPVMLPFCLFGRISHKASHPFQHRGRQTGDFTLYTLVSIQGSGPDEQGHSQMQDSHHLSPPKPGLPPCYSFCKDNSVQAQFVLNFNPEEFKKKISVLGCPVYDRDSWFTSYLWRHLQRKESSHQSYSVCNVHTHTNIPTCIHTYIQHETSLSIHVCSYLCKCIYIHIHMHTCINKHISKVYIYTH